ncbi:MAG: endonuclease III domain-containing protein [Desulfobulbaceae bacterium]|nr:endonuclease III domain-containing protein [Desulfobulbaceae bacterium]
MSTVKQLQEMYDRLYTHFGSQNWWPAETPFEVMVGAVLTQNTNWNNVERAITNLKDAEMLSLDRMSEMPVTLLAEYIRPAGYYNIKAGRLQNLFQFINDHYNGELEKLLELPVRTLREELLTVKGIGPETADSMVLYAAAKPIFVVDAYTHRILSRHDIIDEEYYYHEIQELFMDNLEENVSLFNEYHALLVRVGKEFCKKSKPVCEQCPLSGFAGVRGYPLNE